MDELIKEYKQSLKKVNESKTYSNDKDTPILSRMSSDLEYSIRWMKIGHKPDNVRGIERRAAYQRELPMDPLIIQNFVSNQTAGNLGVSEFDKERIKDALSCLTELEKDVYLMARGKSISRNEIAELMDLKKGTINKILKRCDEKIYKHTRYSIFCLPIATY